MCQFLQNETFIAKNVSTRASSPENPGKEAIFFGFWYCFCCSYVWSKINYITDFSFYFALIQACSVNKLEFQRFYEPFIEIILTALIFTMESWNQISCKSHWLVSSTLENYRSENLSNTQRTLSRNLPTQSQQ